MAIKNYKSTTPGRRGMTGYTFEEVTKSKPEKSLTVRLNKRSGRNNQGRLTVRHRGGGHKKLYRIVDFNRADKHNIEGTVTSVEYDPYRTAYIMLVQYKDGEKRYHLAPRKIKVGDSIMLAEKTKLKPGNRMLLENFPIGFTVYNIELTKGKGGQMIRSAGASAKVISQEDAQYTQIQLPSGEIRLVDKGCYASSGMVSNIDHINITIGKAGRKRNMGKRPQVRGKVMNPCDHPHGGGEGNQPIGLKHPKTPWGMPALGYKTRKRKYSDRLIVKSRHRK
ncbi:50S ribosomal protein L2 [Candidatus Peregrinibacteria bacterium]|nr:50S ribosomal protein L2 [Candidatus Peregrinibacteria bacterium]